MMSSWSRDQSRRGEAVERIIREGVEPIVLTFQGIWHAWKRGGTGQWHGAHMTACIFKMSFIIEGLTRRHVVTSIIGHIVEGGGIPSRGIVCNDIMIAAR